MTAARVIVLLDWMRMNFDQVTGMDCAPALKMARKRLGRDVQMQDLGSAFARVNAERHAPPRELFIRPVEPRRKKPRKPETARQRRARIEAA